MGKQTYFETLNRMNSDSIKWALAERKCGSSDCLTFSIADSDYEVAPPIKEALKHRVQHGAFGYAGIGDDYKKIVAHWHKDRFGLDVEEEDIIPSHSVLNALSMLIQIYTDLNDAVLIQPPVYHVFRRVIESNERIVSENRLIRKKDGYIIDFDDLENHFRSGIKVFVLCSPHNPVGRVWKKDELKQLIDLARKYEVWVFSDEIHADIIMPKNRFFSAGLFFHHYEKIIAITAPSKTFNIAGLQIANMITPEKNTREKIIAKQQALHLTSPNLMAVTALKAAYQKGVPWLKAQNEQVMENYNVLKLFIEGLSKHVWLAPLEGTYLAWMDISAYEMDSVTFTKRLANEANVVLSDGDKYGDDRFIRINLACSNEQLSEGLKRLKDFLEKVQDKN